MSPTRMKTMLAVLPLVAACATPPKPSELEAFEKIKQTSSYDAAKSRSPKLVAESDALLAKAQDEWKDNDLEEARRDALMGAIDLKTALALVEYDQSKARVDKANAQLRTLEGQLAQVNKDLQETNEQVMLLQKLKATSSQAAMQQEKMKLELAKHEAESKAKEKIAEAELALKGADNVQAAQYAKVEYQSAQDSLARARAQLQAGDFQTAAETADMARDQASRAAQTAKPGYEATESSKSSQAQNEALARDLSGIAGVQVRLERRGDVQRASVPLHGLFSRNSTVILPGHDGVLDQLAAIMKKYPSYQVMVVGFTDNHGRRDRLLALSQARATSVFSALVSRGVPSKRMVVSGNGADQPVSDNHTRAGRALNNRVEVVFLYQ